MCRWFAYISPTEPCLLTDVLINPANAISKQCSEHYLPGLLPQGQEKELDDATDKLLQMRNSMLNMDGLGISWYTPAASNYVKGVEGDHPALYKSQSPPINDFNFRSRHVFMHNGAISNFLDIRRDMTDLHSFDNFCNIFGTTDSEHAAALYMTYLTGGIQNATKDKWEKEYPVSAMKDAMINTVISIMKLQHAKLGSKKAPNSLNFCTTDGKKMVAIRFRNHATQQPPSLYWSEFAGRTLNEKYPGNPDSSDQQNDTATKPAEDHGKHTIIASEPTTYDESEWHLINANSILMVDENGTEVEEKIPFDASLNAVDPNNP
ncbi:MAG: hypothetical protein M1831_006913 [Alyxoria varia]|nr:MAG: hypothetical protein M1831_006913 [Alyxoria varia]